MQRFIRQLDACGKVLHFLDRTTRPISIDTGLRWIFPTTVERKINIVFFAVSHIGGQIAGMPV